MHRETTGPVLAACILRLLAARPSALDLYVGVDVGLRLFLSTPPVTELLLKLGLAFTAASILATSLLV